MAQVAEVITITFADTGSPALTATDVAKITAAILQISGSRTVTATYTSNALALAVT